MRLMAQSLIFQLLFRHQKCYTHPHTLNHSELVWGLGTWTVGFVSLLTLPRDRQVAVTRGKENLMQDVGNIYYS